MFNVRRLRPRLLTVLTLAGLGMAGLVATAAPASAHTTDGSRTCSSLTVNFSSFKSDEQHPSVVNVELSANGKVFHTDAVSLTTSGGSKTYANVPASVGTVHVHTWWNNTGKDHNTNSHDFDKDAPKNCGGGGAECARKGYFTFTFDGPNGAATVTLHGEKKLCSPVTVLLASYQTEGPTWETSGHQTVFDQVSQTIDTPGTYPLKVKIPNCFTQVDLYVTDQKAVDFDFPNDSLGKFLASNFWKRTDTESGKGTSAWNGGKTGCTEETVPPTPTPTPTTPGATPTTVAPTSTAPAAPVSPGTSLPNTGASPLPKVLFAIVLLGVGTGLAFLGRRRRRIAG